jgi:hypothetical protein
LRCLGDEEWLVTVIGAMYEAVTTAVRMKDEEVVGLEVQVGVHQGSMLSLLQFIIVLEAWSRKTGDWVSDVEEERGEGRGRKTWKDRVSDEDAVDKERCASS